MFFGVLSLITRGRRSTKDYLTLEIVVGQVKNLRSLPGNHFQQHVVLFNGDKLIQSFSQHYRATKYAHVDDVHCTPLRKSATILFLVFVTKTTIDHQDIDTQESDLILADVLCQELVTLECCTRAEPAENMFETKKIA